MPPLAMVKSDAVGMMTFAPETSVPVVTLPESVVAEV